MDTCLAISKAWGKLSTLHIRSYILCLYQWACVRQFPTFNLHVVRNPYRACITPYACIVYWCTCMHVRDRAITSPLTQFSLSVSLGEEWPCVMCRCHWAGAPPLAYLNLLNLVTFHQTIILFGCCIPSFSLHVTQSPIPSLLHKVLFPFPSTKFIITNPWCPHYMCLVCLIRHNSL